MHVNRPHVTNPAKNQQLHQHSKKPNQEKTKPSTEKIRQEPPLSSDLPAKVEESCAKEEKPGESASVVAEVASGKMEVEIIEIEDGDGDDGEREDDAKKKKKTSKVKIKAAVIPQPYR